MEKSKGFWTKHSRKVRKPVRRRGLVPLTRVLQEFSPGDRVHIKIEPSVHKGMPHPRFHGYTGVVRERRGRAYVVEIKDGNATKQIIALPVHLEAQKK
ncbi:MAG: 50S ribosomal protein L21e [Euryarchaeota archaeon]|nr:50S ribosomal protein L21e [Euryarchaeota archaeon]